MQDVFYAGVLRPRVPSITFPTNALACMFSMLLQGSSLYEGTRAAFSFISVFHNPSKICQSYPKCSHYRFVLASRPCLLMAPSSPKVSL